MKIYLRVRTILGVTALFLLPTISFASPKVTPAVSLKIGVLDTQGSITQLHEAQKAIKDMEAEGAKLLEAEQKAKVEIETKSAKYREGADKLTEKARMQEETRLNAEFSQIQQALATKGEEHNKKGQEISKAIKSKVQHTTESVAKKLELDLVLESAAVLYMKKESVTDITAEVVKAYNTAFPVALEKNTKAVDKKGKK